MVSDFGQPGFAALAGSDEATAKISKTSNLLGFMAATSPGNRAPCYTE
jgi:hypothetical protein